MPEISDYVNLSHILCCLNFLAEICNFSGVWFCWIDMLYMLHTLDGGCSPLKLCQFLHLARFAVFLLFSYCFLTFCGVTLTPHSRPCTVLPAEFESVSFLLIFFWNYTGFFCIVGTEEHYGDLFWIVWCFENILLVKCWLCGLVHCSQCRQIVLSVFPGFTGICSSWFHFSGRFPPFFVFLHCISLVLG